MAAANNANNSSQGVSAAAAQIALPNVAVISVNLPQPADAFAEEDELLALSIEEQRFINEGIGGGSSNNSALDQHSTKSRSRSNSAISANSLSVITLENKRIPGMDCYGDERSAMAEFERFYNNALLSDVTLAVGDEIQGTLPRFSFYAHKLLLVKSSDVFERMLSQQWNGDTKKEVELVEDRICARVFPSFLRFLYCYHITLHYDNALPILILADKYNVKALRKVCLDYAVHSIIPNLPLKEVFHVWFQYGTKSNHSSLISVCVNILAQNFQEIISCSDWEREWVSLEREQLAELLKSSEITVTSEYDLWLAVLRWLTTVCHQEKHIIVAEERNLTVLVPLVRFPLMTPDELSVVEKSAVVVRHMKLFHAQIMQAYKFNSLPLYSRVGNVKDFSSSQFLLRNYTDLRWDKRLTIPNFSQIQRWTDITLRVTTRASAVPAEMTWEWELKVHPKGFSQNCDEFRVFLSSNVIVDQSIRPVEYLLSVVDDKSIQRSVTGKKNFNKTRYTADLEMEKRVSMDELQQLDSSLLVNDTLCLQLTLRPIID